jgi:hypothetical protein
MCVGRDEISLACGQLTLVGWMDSDATTAALLCLCVLHSAYLLISSLAMHALAPRQDPDF